MNLITYTQDELIDEFADELRDIEPKKLIQILEYVLGEVYTYDDYTDLYTVDLGD